MMKIIRVLLFLYAVLGGLTCANAGSGKLTQSATFKSVTLYYGISQLDVAYQLRMHIMVATGQGVYYGVYSVAGWAGSTLNNLSWSGPDPVPVIKIVDYDNSVDKSHCPGMHDHWGCGSFTVSVTVDLDDYTCPWVTSTYITSGDPMDPGYIYYPPVTRNSDCPAVPVETFDISWDPNTTKHSTLLKLDATGGTVNSTLHTYLMQSGKLCDGSQYDQRGQYCRFVASGITLNVLGCDQATVTTDAVAHPITDVELHDINVAVDTRNIGSGQFTSTCSFQYIINEL